MKIDLHMQFYRLLWRLAKKQKEHIEEYDIRYVKLPWWLLVGGSNTKSFFVNAMTLLHSRSKTSMIFLSSTTCSSDRFRYTLYHEYMESCWGLGAYAPWNHKRMERQCIAALKEIKKDMPGVEHRLREALENRQSRSHIFSLIMELALAKRELPQDVYQEYLQYALEKRL